MHSYLYPKHELMVAEIARDIGFSNISVSHSVMPMIKIVPRAFTGRFFHHLLLIASVTADAYLTPCIRTYVESFSKGFRGAFGNMQVLFMQSDGGLSPANDFLGSRAILSGPAGGVIAYAKTSFDGKQPVVGFDMGGTSTDVSRFGGELEHVFEKTTAGVSIQAPQLDVNTVAAGGGSCLAYSGGLYRVGPESAGAYPGPVAYGNVGGKLTITDANLVLGRLLPAHFPAIFGPEHNAPLDLTAARQAFVQLSNDINAYSSARDASVPKVSVEDVALGFIRVANETMCRPIRSLTQGKGYDTSKHLLACFGGAGGQHACSIARLLGMKKVHIHRYAGILSAYGLALADVVREEQLPCQLLYKPENLRAIGNLITKLVNKATDRLVSEGFDRSRIVTEAFLHMRYEGTDGALMCQANQVNNHSEKAVPPYGDFEASFVERYKREFGFTLSNRNIVVDDVRVRGRAVSTAASVPNIEEAPCGSHPEPVEFSNTYFDQGLMRTSVYLLDNLLAGHEIHGPAIIIASHSTILVEPNCSAFITRTGDMEIRIGVSDIQQPNLNTEMDAIQLSIFSHRFMSIAEQMGRVLQRTAISTNIKERLDFSCALFDSDGGLVANAPHIPVHLGAMQHAVQYQIKATNNRFSPGDVLLSNHPCAGGSHLPDLTVITPVFVSGSSTPSFFFANRGHHADIGGSTPGSMPPHSTSIHEEGAVFTTFYLVKDGCFQEEAVTAALMAPAAYPGSSGTRNLSDNLSDLKAQVAANQKGVFLLMDLVEEYGLEVVQAYMKHIQDNAEYAVRHMLRGACLQATNYDQTGSYRTDVTDSQLMSSPLTLSAVDHMDDGTPISLKVSVNPVSGSAHFDFTGTGPEVFGNTNAPRAVLLSCLFYALRCLVGGEICLNHGCLKPIKLTVPDGTILSASPTAAVVGGNVLTSQRIVDVIFAAFRCCAASQGCMNNVTFGTDKLGYYETVAGGAGAGPGWHGRSGIHTHMTNTRITDPEILEQRYPVILEHFGFRVNSGGLGRWNGGNGLTRRMKFRSAVTLSVLSERRSLAPYGLFGGQPGVRGLNLLHRVGHPHPVNIGGKATVSVNPGDVFILHTPGGGGFGSPDTMVT
ncbi:5-oxoprolinase [Clonorchis sinensis]|uniref:5-oxoprolinase n=1 Tax=Clonorchis sinensis TaxID=79923 RepID=G7Y3I1_CLOSI|nr:5-oxoprolinase [Clonorchis sinensis]